MAKMSDTRATVLRMLAEAPAFSTDIADEMDIAVGMAGHSLRRLYDKGVIARRAYYVSKNKIQWLYLLPEHQKLIEGK